MRRPRASALISVVIALVLLVFGIELHYAGTGKVPFFARLVLLILLNITILALLVLIFFVAKSLVKVYLERKNRVPGYRFKTKIVVIIVVLTMIPSSFLFVVSSGVVTNYLDRWFDPQIKQPLSLSIEIAKSAYEMQRQQVLAYAKAVAAGRPSPGNYTVMRLAKPPADASETVKAAFEGKAGVEVGGRPRIPGAETDRRDGCGIISQQGDEQECRKDKECLSELSYAGVMEDAFKNELPADTQLPDPPDHIHGALGGAQDFKRDYGPHTDTGPGDGGGSKREP
ncbi:MAG: hypothetical protein P8Z71_10370 [Candidatus Sulfobium sp.]